MGSSASTVLVRALKKKKKKVTAGGKGGRGRGEKEEIKSASCRCYAFASICGDLHDRKRKGTKKRANRLCERRKKKKGEGSVFTLVYRLRARGQRKRIKIEHKMV